MIKAPLCLNQKFKDRNITSYGDLYHSVKEPLENLSKSVVKGIYSFDDFILESDIEDAFPGARKVMKNL